VSIMSSLFIGAGGMTAHGNAIGVVGDNIANVSTIGYKRSRAAFADVLGGSLGGQRLGAGVRLGGVQTMMGQGSVQQTGGAFDMAIRGNGMFVVKGNHGGQDSQYYTRDGRFSLDSNGVVVNGSGLKLQGYTIDPATGAMSTSPGDLDLAGQDAPPVATTTAQMSFHLDSNAAVGAAWDPANPDTTSNNHTTVTVHDSLGNAHQLDVYFRKDAAAGKWEWHAMADGAELTGGTAGTPTQIANGELTFDTNGRLDVESMLSSSASFVGASPNQAIAFDFGDAITTDGGTGSSGTTQDAGAFAVNGLDIDGHSAGKLVEIEIGDDGTIHGIYDNGDTRDVARVALAMFGAETELTRNGDGLYTESSASGQPLIGAAGTGGRGAISGGALEGSNVDLGAELVTMIAYQRAFQANVKTVTTADEMLSEVANLKR
jgi:flagellar hook protein FlgE